MKRRVQFNTKINGDTEVKMSLKIFKDCDKLDLTWIRCVFWGMGL